MGPPSAREVLPLESRSASPTGPPPSAPGQQAQMIWLLQLWPKRNIYISIHISVSFPLFLSYSLSLFLFLSISLQQQIQPTLECTKARPATVPASLTFPELSSRPEPGPSTAKGAPESRISAVKTLGGDKSAIPPLTLLPVPFFLVCFSSA